MTSKLLKVAALLLCLFSGISSAQAQGFSIKLRLVDSKSGEGVPFATVSLTREGKSNVEKYGQADDNGNIEIKGVKGGKYVLRGILLGYDDYEEIITISKSENLGEKKMNVQVNFLEGATVTDVGNPIIVKKDTIEHNVSLMKSSDNDVLEDLLKRLPGVEVSSDGTITANGKTISKIQIDGKQFFADDPSLASKNLPAKIINKVRVVEKQSEQAEFTGIDDGEEETVLDLSVKKGMMNGWFGNVMGGGGSDLQGRDANNDFRYQGAAMVANFTESTQMAFIGNANNTNNRGFRDMMSSSMGGMRGGGMRGGMGGGGMRGNGISSSYMTGFNGGKTWDNKSELVGNAMFNGNERYVEENTAKTTFNKDGSSLYTLDDGYSITNTYGVRGGIRADLRATEKTSFIFDPNFNLGWGNFEEKSTFLTDKTSAQGITSKVNKGESLSTGDSRNQNANGRLLWRQRLGKPGRTISVNMRYNFQNTDMDGYNKSTTETFTEGNAKSESIDQWFRSNSRTQGANARMSYTEPLGKNFYLEANYGFNYNYRTSTKSTFDKDASGKYSVKDVDYSSDVTNEFFRHNAGFNLRKQEEKYNMSVGASFQPQTTHNHTTRGLSSIDTTLKVFNWSPNARIDFNFSDYQMLRINYRGRTTQPTITQMMPVPDNSNPQRITLGNMGLNPSFSHNLWMMYRSTNMENYASFNINFNASYNTSSIVNASWTDATGVTYTVPMNNDKGSYSMGSFIMFNSPIAKSNFSIMSFTNIRFSTGVSFVGDESIISDDESSYLNLANYTQNENRSVSAGENLRFVYRDDIFEASLGGGVSYSQAWYTITSKNVAPTFNNNVEARFLANIPDVLNVSTDARYTFYKGYGAGYNDPRLVWNAEVSKQIIHNQFTVALKAYDILNQSKNTYRTTTDNYVMDTRNNTLGRYVIISLTYRFGTFGGQKGGHGPMMGRGPMGHPRR